MSKIEKSNYGCFRADAQDFYAVLEGRLSDNIKSNISNVDSNTINIESLMSTIEEIKDSDDYKSMFELLLSHYDESYKTGRDDQYLMNDCYVELISNISLIYFLKSAIYSDVFDEDRLAEFLFNIDVLLTDDAVRNSLANEKIIGRYKIWFEEKKEGKLEGTYLSKDTLDIVDSL